MQYIVSIIIKTFLEIFVSFALKMLVQFLRNCISKMIPRKRKRKRKRKIKVTTVIVKIKVYQLK
ncbi:hypothetical protein BK136_09880 [Paenibacillus amylolyticus]|nr:hypothetical protein BK136_09880 [Paenibacillus amylolyticus]